VQRTCSCQTILRRRGNIASILCSMNSVPRMHGTDTLSETRKRSKMRIPPVSTNKCMAYSVTRRFLFASQIRGSVVSFSAQAIQFLGSTLVRTMFTPAPVFKPGRQLRIRRRHGPSVAAISYCRRARRNSFVTVRFRVPPGNPKSGTRPRRFSSRRCLRPVPWSRHPRRCRHRRSRERRLADGDARGGDTVPRVAQRSVPACDNCNRTGSVGLGSSGPRRFRRTNRCERSVHCSPLVLCFVSDFDRR